MATGDEVSTQVVVKVDAPKLAASIHILELMAQAKLLQQLIEELEQTWARKGRGFLGWFWKGSDEALFNVLTRKAYCARVLKLVDEARVLAQTEAGEA